MWVSLMVALVAAQVAAPDEPLPEFGIPFGCGRTFSLSQGHNAGTHVRRDAWAWDFEMPQGVPIVAAREGWVAKARGDSTVGGCHPLLAGSANFVVLDHGNGIETQYLHLSSVVVRPGEHVVEGQLLGYSGSTGFSCRPHLHFKVMRRETEGWNHFSVPATLRGVGDPMLGTRVAAPVCGAPSAQPLLTGEPNSVHLKETSAPSEPAPSEAPGDYEVFTAWLLPIPESFENSSVIGRTPRGDPSPPVIDLG
jgi:murein DD-endopeptidase MepM/ murein hydrolase activator NlpD